jgi:hypothetical protein
MTMVDGTILAVSKVSAANLKRNMHHNSSESSSTLYLHALAWLVATAFGSTYSRSTAQLASQECQNFNAPPAHKHAPSSDRAYL